MDRCYAFVALFPTSKGADFLAAAKAALLSAGLTVDEDGTLPCDELLKTQRLTRFRRDQMQFGKAVQYLCISWTAGTMPWPNMLSAVEAALPGAYVSRSALEGLADRMEWLGRPLLEDPVGKLVVEHGGDEGIPLLERYIRNVYLKRENANIHDITKHQSTKALVELIYADQLSFVDAMHMGKSLGPRRSTMRVTGEPPEGKEVFTDTAFMERHTEFVDEWRRIGDLYPEPEDGALLPNTLSPEHFAQGGQMQDCTLLSAVAMLCVRHPQIIDHMFVSKEVRKDGRYTFQFYQWDQWVRIEVDDQIPIVRGEILNTRSPTQHWWPLLLEKAFAKFYGSYSAIQGGSMSEVLHDLTAKPVESYVLNDEFVEQGAIPDFNETDFWIGLKDDIEKGHIEVAFPASRGDGSDGTATREDAEELGFEVGHGYGVLGIRLVDGGKTIEKVLLKVHNPFAALTYKGPYNPSTPEWTGLLGEKAVTDPAAVVPFFYVPVSEMLAVARTLFIVRIKGVEPHPYLFINDWKGETAGGPPTSTAWRKNPIYVVRNDTDEDVTSMVVIKQVDQRGRNGDGSLSYSGKGQFNYKQCGLSTVQHVDPDLGDLVTPYLCNNIFRLQHKGVYMNQREVCDRVVFAARSTTYVVPSTFEVGDMAKFLLLVYLPTGCSPRRFLVEELRPNVDVHYPLRSTFSLAAKAKVHSDIVIHAPTQLHLMLSQRADKSQSEEGASDLTCDAYVAMMVYDSKNKKIASMSSGLNYKENALVLNIETPGRYSVLATCLRSSEDVVCDLFACVDPDSMAVFCEHRDLVAEADDEEAYREDQADQEDIAKEEAEAKKRAEEAAAKKAAQEAEKKRQVEEAAAKKAAEEAAKQRKADEAAAKKAEEEADRKRKADEAATKKAEQEAEKKRVAEEAAAKKAEGDAEKKRKADEAAAKKAHDDAEKKQLAEEAAAKKAEEAAAKKAHDDEEKRQRAEEAAAKKAEQDAEKERKAEEAAAKKAEEDAERKRVAEEAAAKKAEEEAIKKQKAQEAAAKKAEEDAEKQQKAEEAAAKKAEHDAEKKRKAEDAAAAKKAHEDEEKRQKAEEAAAKKAEHDAEKKRKAEELAEENKAAAERRAAERAERKQADEERRQNKAAAATAAVPKPPKSPKASGGHHAFSAQAAERLYRHKPRKPSSGEPSSARQAYTDQSPQLPPIRKAAPHQLGFGSSSPRMVSNYAVLPYIQKHEECAL